MTADDARPGSGTDLSRRMDRMEQNHETLAKDVSALAGTVGRVELNQIHAEELNKLRFDGLTAAVATNSGKIDTFMARIDSILEGTTETAQGRAGRELVTDYKRWRESVDTQLDIQDTRNARLDLLGRIVVILVPGNLLAIAAALYTIIQKGGL